MKIVYMGTPDFAVPALEALIEHDQEILYVVTKPDKPNKRGKKLVASPVKQVAENHNIQVLQPERIKGNEDFFNKITNASPDLIVVAAYGKILPIEILEIPQKGCINIHASLLPKYRGSAPIHRAVANGDDITGVTLMYMSEGMDEGDMIATSETVIDRKTTGMLYEELADLGARLLIESLDDIENNKIKRIPQDGKEATYAGPVSKEEGHIDFSKGGTEVDRQIRAMTPFPGAYSLYEDKKMKIWQGDVSTLDADPNKKPGTITDVSDKGIIVNTATGKQITLTRIQMPGKKPVAISDYLRGNSISENIELE